MFDRIFAFARDRRDRGASDGQTGDEEDDYRARQGERMFPLGHVTVTPAAQALLGGAALDVREFLRQHVRGYWGIIGQAQWADNEYAVQWGGRVVSYYPFWEKGIFVYSDVLSMHYEGVIDVSRMRTVVLTPEEFH